MKIFVSLNILLAILFCMSCSHDVQEGIVSMNGSSTKTITFVTSPNALNDKGYASMIVEALMKSEKMHGYRLRLVVPQSVDMGIIHTEDLLWKYYSLEADDSLAVDKYNKSCEENLLIIGDGMYKDAVLDFAMSVNAPNDKFWQSVIMFETADEDLPCRTFNIEKFGAMYIAGNIATVYSPNVALITAYEDNENLNSAIEGFKEGCDSSGFCDNFSVVYLAEDSRGFNMPIEARSVADSLYSMDEFVFIMPLAGASNEGIYLSSRENDFSYCAGMDYDVHAKSDEIAFNILIHIDSLLNNYVDAFLAGSLSSMDKHAHYGLSSGFIEVVPVAYYSESSQEWIDYLLPEAMMKEERYLRKYRELTNERRGR